MLTACRPPSSFSAMCPWSWYMATTPSNAPCRALWNSVSVGQGPLASMPAARAEGLDASGPWPSDTLFVRAHKGEFDGVVAMYHDQGHIALKLLGGLRAVNISAGLPLVRTSVAHGTAYDIAGRGTADAASLVEAARVAALLTR